MNAPAAGFAVLAGVAGVAACWSVLMKIGDVAIWNWIAGGRGARTRLPVSIALEILGAVGRAQERTRIGAAVSRRAHAGAAGWLGRADPGPAVWLAGKEAAFLGTTLFIGWALDSVGFALAFGIAAFFLPDFLARDRYERRQELVRRELPDVLDLLALCFEAGLGIDAGFRQVSDKYRGGILPAAIDRMLAKVRFGGRRHQAWREMAEEVGTPDLVEIVGALIQADSMGIGLADALTKLSAQMRVRRRQQVEEAAHKAPVRLLFPLALLIFPAIFVVLLGPVFLNLVEVFG